MSGKNILFNYNWDVNKYKSNYDPEYWDLCRTFMEIHKTKYPEQKLSHLTEAFYQIGVYGSSYDAKTTRMVSALAVEVLDDFLERHPGALRHPFKIGTAGVVISEVIDITEEDNDPTKEDASKSSSKSSSIWDAPVDSTILVNVQKSQYLNTLFRGFVIIYDIIKTSMMNGDKVSILEDSFRRSKFGPLHWDKKATSNTICPIQLALKWKGIVLAEAVGANEMALRLRLAQAILSKLAEFCHGIEAKWIYYRDGKMSDMFIRPNPRKSNIYRILPHSQFKGMVEITSFIDTFANSDSFAEVVFGLDFANYEKSQIIEYVTKTWSTKLTYRTLSKVGVKNKIDTHVCVYHIHTGDELKRWLERTGGENERYRVVFPKKHRRAGTTDNNVREVLTSNKDDEENKKKEAEKKKKQEEENKKREEEKKKKEEEEKKKKEQEKKKKEQEERKKKEEGEKKKKKEEEEKKKKEVADKMRMEENNKKNLEAENKSIKEKQNISLENCVEISGSDFEKLLDGFVLFYDAKKNSEIDKDDWFSALRDSFKISKFGPIDVISESLRLMRTRCVFKWNDKILASAEGLTETQAKTAATLQLISKLEPFTYIIQAKEEYFFGGKVPPFIENPDPSKSHIYRVVRRQDLPSYYTIFQHIDEFLNVPSYSEIIFGKDFTWELKNEIVVYIKAKDLDYRYFTIGDQKPWTHMAVYHTINPEKLKNHLLSNGGENAKYKLIPPPNAQPNPNKTAEVEVIKVSETPVTAPQPPEKVVEKRKQPEKDTTEELEGNKIQIKLKKFKLDKVEYPEDTGGDFPGLILWVGIKKNSTWQRSMFAILLESFKMSKYGELLVEELEEKVWGRKEPLKKCVIKSNRKVLAVGLGESKTEAKNAAALQVLRQLRKHCYTIQAKESYFKEGKATPFDFEPEAGKENVYRLAKRIKFKDRASIIKFIDTFNNTHCNHEVIFGDDFSYDEREAILHHCRQINLSYRLMKCQSTGRMIHTHVAIYHQTPLPTIKATLMSAGGENDKFRLIPPGGKISTQNNQSDLWPETLENVSQEASVNAIAAPDNSESRPSNLVTLPGAQVQSGNKIPVKISSSMPAVPTKDLPAVPITDRLSKQDKTSNNVNAVNTQNRTLHVVPINTQQQSVAKNPEVPQPQLAAPIIAIPYGQQPHPDMPLSFGPQPQPATYVPIHPYNIQVQPAPVDMPVQPEEGSAKVVSKVTDLRDELLKKRQEESVRKKTPERKVYDLSADKKIIRNESERDESWSRKVFVAESDNIDIKDQRNVRKSPGLREKLTQKDLSRNIQHRSSKERITQRSSLDLNDVAPNNQRVMNRQRSPRRNYQSISPNRNRTRYLEKDRPRSPIWLEERRIVVGESSSHIPEREVREVKRVHYPSRQAGRRRSPSPMNYNDRRHRRSDSPTRSRVLWQELAYKYYMDIFMYKYVKQDSTTEKDPIALLRATRSSKFNVDFDFITKKVSFNEWQATVELVTDEDERINILVGESVATSIEEASLNAAHHAVDTVQKACRVIEPNFYYFAAGGVPEFISRKNPMKTNIYEIIQNMEPDFPLDQFTIGTMLKMFVSSKLEDLFFLASDFSYSERMLVIQIADSMDLWWRVFGPRHPDAPPGDIVSTQHVCIYKQKTAFQLFIELLENGGSTEKYKLVYPRDNPI